MSRYRAMIALLFGCVLLGITPITFGRTSSQSELQAGRRILLPIVFHSRRPPPPPTPVPYTLNTQEAQLFAAINARRTQAGCPQLALSVSLAKAGRGHSRDMAERNFFSHTGSDGSRPADRAAAEGYTFNGGFETISAGQTSADQALTTWMGSKSHRTILLNCTLDDGGVGYVRDTDGNGYGYYWTFTLGAR